MLVLFSTLALFSSSGSLPALEAVLQPAPAAPSRDAPVQTAGEDLAVPPLPEAETVEPADPPIDLNAETTTPQRPLDQEVARVEAWLEQLDTLQARFRQIGADGSVTQGVVYLDRPGRVRFEYDDPSPILIVADGTSVAVRDEALETTDRAPIRSTPLRWLLTRDPDLAASGAVTEAGRVEQDFYVTVRDPEGELDGSLTLVFEDPDPDTAVGAMSLKRWFAIDAAGGVTELQLMDPQLGERLDPRLFVLDDEDRSDRRRRG